MIREGGDTLANEDKDSKGTEAPNAKEAPKESPKPEPIRPNPTLAERGGRTRSDIEQL